MSAATIAAGLIGGYLSIGVLVAIINYYLTYRAGSGAGGVDRHWGGFSLSAASTDPSQASAVVAVLPATVAAEAVIVWPYVVYRWISPVSTGSVDASQLSLS